MSGIEKLASRRRSRGGVVVVVGLISVGWLGKGEGERGSERERARQWCVHGKQKIFRSELYLKQTNLMGGRRCGGKKNSVSVVVVERGWWVDQPRLNSRLRRSVQKL